MWHKGMHLLVKFASNEYGDGHLIENEREWLLPTPSHSIFRRNWPV